MRVPCHFSGHYKWRFCAWCFNLKLVTVFMSSLHSMLQRSLLSAPIHLDGSGLHTQPEALPVLLASSVPQWLSPGPAHIGFSLLPLQTIVSWLLGFQPINRTGNTRTENKWQSKSLRRIRDSWTFGQLTQRWFISLSWLRQIPSKASRIQTQGWWRIFQVVLQKCSENHSVVYFPR